MKKTMKSIMSVLLAAIMVFGASTVGMVGLEANAAALKEGNYEYTVENGEATIVGYAQSALFTKSDVVIPKTLGGYPVTAIGDHAFMAQLMFEGAEGSQIESVYIPACIESIGYLAFNGSEELKTVTIEAGSKLETIGERAFSGCTLLSNMSAIPASVKNIGHNAFSVCYALEKIVVDPANTAYSNDANGVLFNKDKTLLIEYPAGNKSTSYTIPASVTEIAADAFYVLPDTLATIAFDKNTKITEISDEAFSGSRIKSITIPDSVTRIGKEAFRASINLETVTFGANSKLETIDESAFGSCYTLESIYIPKTVKTIDVSAWPQNGVFAQITVDSANAYYCSENGILYNKDKTELVCFPSASKITNYTVPSSIKEIKHSVFSRCYNLTNVTLPADLPYIPDYMFYDCKNLKSIVIPDSVKSIGKYAFCGCESLSSVTFGKNTKVEEIGEWTFANCDSLTSFNLPKTVKKLGRINVFSDSITDIYYGGTKADLMKIEKYDSINNDVLIHYSDSTTGYVLSPSTSISINEPSTTDLCYGETLVLRATSSPILLPEGTKVVWSVSGSGVKISGSSTGWSCNVKATGNGTATVTAKLVDAKGNAVKTIDGKTISDSVKITSDGSFWQRILSFFRDLFGMNRVIDK